MLIKYYYTIIIQNVTLASFHILCINMLHVNTLGALAFLVGNSCCHVEVGVYNRYRKAMKLIIDTWMTIFVFWVNNPFFNCCGTGKWGV